MVIATDQFNSFAIFVYQRLDTAVQGACLFPTPSANSSLMFLTTSSNCTQGGSFVALINAGSNL
jgi:hypothetical protein